MNKQMDKNKSRKIVNILLFIIFILFAIVQLNDPDPIIWFTIYGIVAVVSIVSNYKTVPKMVIFMLTFLLIIYASMHFSYFVDWLQIDSKKELFGKMVYKKPYLEGTREFLGLLMGAGALFFQLIQSDNK